MNHIRIKATIFFVAFSFSFIFSVAFAQQTLPKGASYLVAPYIGKNVKHSKRQLYDISEQSYGLELGYEQRLFGQKAWHEWRNYPTVGVALLYYSWGNPDVLGSSVSVFPNFTMNVFRIGNVTAYGRAGLGLGYVTKKYSEKTNPTNTGVSVSLNALEQLRGGLKWQITPEWSSDVVIGATHHSNGFYELPNFGINSLDASILVRYTPNPLKKADFQTSEMPKPEKRWHLDTRAEVAWKESALKSKAKLPVYALNAEVEYWFNQQHHLKTGLLYEQNIAVAAAGKEQGIFKTDAEARVGSSRLAATLSDELACGDYSAIFQYGYYLGDFSQRLVQQNFLKFGFRRYFPNDMHLGIYLKFNGNVAEYLSVGGGIRL